MSGPVNLPDDLAAAIDHVAADRAAFVAEAVRRLLRESTPDRRRSEVEAINRVADALNEEAESVLEYQVIS
jgi:metal-responsive CopG/Arc/MetJ family transcriptional regulator